MSLVLSGRLKTITRVIFVFIGDPPYRSSPADFIRLVLYRNVREVTCLPCMACTKKRSTRPFWQALWGGRKLPQRFYWAMAWVYKNGRWIAARHADARG